MRSSTKRPPLTGLYAAVVVLWTISHVWHVQAFSRRVSSRAIHHRHHGILIGSVSGDGVSGSSSVSAPRGRHGHVLHAVPSNKSVPSVPPTNTTTATTATTNNVSLQNQNPLAPRLEELRARHQRGETLTQEYCDTLLASCVAQDEWDMVLDVLEIMNKSGLVQVRSTYRACLQACYSNAASAEQILNAMEQAGIPPEPADIAVTVAAMCRQEKKERGVWWPRALQLLLTANDNSINNNNNTTDLPLRIYDAVLACLTDDRQWKESIRLLRRMEQQQPGALTTTTTIPLTSTTQPALTTYRLVIECCVASRQAEQAVQVLQSCVKRGLVPTVYSFELVVSALSKKLQWRRAVQLLDLMDDLKIKKTLMIYNTILSALAKAGEVVQANNLLVQMRKSDIQPTIKSYNSVMSACASTSRWKDALSVLDQCHRAPGVSPDIYTYTIAMRACAKGGNTQQALSLLQVVKDKGLPVDTYCYTAAIEACSKAKMWKKALELLHEMEEKGVSPSEVTYSITITACGNGGQWRKALDLLELMRTKGMSINVITYNSAITAISKAAKQSSRAHYGDGGELWQKVVGLLSQMKADGLEPDGFSYASAISCCGSEGRWEEALALMEIMEKGGPRTRPNKIAYTAAISSCGRAGQVEHAVRLFKQMKDQGMAADRVAYNALFSALRVAKKSDIAYGLWGEICGRPQSLNTTAIATANSDRFTRPDIITVTEAVAAMAADDNEKGRERVDGVFVEAVNRGIVLRKDTLDSQCEFDLSGLSFPVARAACRFLVGQMLENANGNDALVDLTFITGVGANSNRRPSHGQADTSEEKMHATSLREYVQEILLSDFDPPITSFVPKRAQGTVQIKGSTLEPHLK